MKCLIGFVAILALAVVFGQAEEFKCEAGVPYIENECNGCFCSQTGALGCTQKACIGPKTSELYNCQVGTKWTKDCNECWCADKLGTICTNKKC